jgi:hypothetical protein
MIAHNPRALIFAAVVALVLTATGCVGTVSVGMAVPGPYMGPYGGSVYVGATVPVGW